MKQIFLVLFVAFVYTNALSQQNLVPNPSFEDYSACPEFVYPELTLAIPWFDPWTYSIVAPGQCDPMFFHNCSVDPVVLFFLKFQEPRTDSGYSMASIFQGPNSGGFAREYIEVELLDTLDSGKTYCVSIWMSLIDSVALASDRVGFHFSDTLVYFPCYNNSLCPLFDLAPQVESTYGMLTDQENWMHITGSFTASGGEKFLTIGNFFPLDSTNYIYLPGGYLYPGYFIDDVAVYECGTPSETANAGNDTIICMGDSLILGSHNLPEYRYYWYIDSVLVSREAMPVFSPSQTTTYILQVKDFKFDESFDTVVVRVIDCDTIPGADAGPDTLICLGDSIEIGQNTNSHNFYQWHVSGSSQIISVNPTAIVKPVVSTTYVLSMTDYVGKQSSDTIHIDVIDCDKIQAEATGDTLICSGDSALLTAYEYHYAGYAWFSDLVFLGDSHELMVSPEQTQTYTLEVTDPKNRITRDEVIVEIEECDIPLDIPNVFTPNGDGKNDKFNIINPLEATLDISVFNRWGELIFMGDERNFWDGMLEDKTASEGVYFYQIRAIKTFRRSTEYTGTIHLLR